MKTRYSNRCDGRDRKRTLEKMGRNGNEMDYREKKRQSESDTRKAEKRERM